MSTERLPCGCAISTKDGTFYYQPCSPDCQWYRYTLAQAALKGMPTQTVTLACYSCGAANDSFAGIGAADPGTPDAGAISICAYCAAVSVFTGRHLETRRPTADELADVMADPDVLKAIGAIQHMRGTA